MSFSLSKSTDQKLAEVLKALDGGPQGYCYKCNSRFYGSLLPWKDEGMVWHCYKCKVLTVISEEVK